MLQYTDSPMDPPYIWYNFFPWLFFKFCISMHDAQDGARGSVEAFHQKSERWMWFSLVQELWVQQLLYGITDNHIAQLEQAASNCVSLLEHVSTPREHAFLSVMIFFLPETLSMLQAYYILL